MESLLVSTGVVALAEIGDKTQLLAFILAARFKKPLPIILGILVATVVNHGLAGTLTAWITSAVTPEILRWVLGASFIGMAVWTLIPDKIEDEETQTAQRFGVFGATLITFFLAEMGDKTQIATVAMAAHYANPLLVVIGTTLGMLIADVPSHVCRRQTRRQDPDEAGSQRCCGDFCRTGRRHTAGRRRPVRPLKSAAGHLHALDQHRSDCFGTVVVRISTHRHNVFEHGFQVTRNGDLLHRVSDAPFLHPKATGATRVVSRHPIDAATQQLGDKQAGTQALQHRGQFITGLGQA